MPARSDRLLVATVVALASCLAAAQVPESPTHWPTPQEIDRALQANPFPGAERIGAQPVASPPRIDAKRSGIDIESLARRGIQPAGPGGVATAGTAALRIFVTLEMPRPSLELLVDQAARTGAVLVLRGLKAQSLRETLRVVGDLIGSRTVAWVIDPEAFTRYGVTVAPTFVLARAGGDTASPGAQHGCSDGCATPATFVRLAGDVSLDYALEAMQRQQPAVAPLAAPLLARLRAP